MRKTANRRQLTIAAGVMTSLVLAGCDFEVSNPGPVHDVNMDDEAAHAGMVIGALRGTLLGFSIYAQQGAAVVRELAPGGGAGAGGHFDEIELGTLGPLDRHPADAWLPAQQGRWIAEQAIERFRNAVGDRAGAYAPLGQAYLWAGLANRILGEHVCSAVIDGKAPQPYTVHFTRAVEQFNQAEAIAATVRDERTRMAAIALRAAANVQLGKWAEAVIDANKVPLDFTFSATYPTGGGSYQNQNSITGRTGTFWHTVWEAYFPATGDPRAAWGNDPRFRGATARANWGMVLPFYYPLKFYLPHTANERTVFAPNSTLMQAIPVNLATGREMRLIRAEAALMQNNLTEAMTLINGVRQLNKNYFTGATLAPVTGTTITQGWAALKMERHVELLMEGRRFGDRKRWAVNKTPGALDPEEYIPDELVRKAGVSKEPHLCFPVPRDELESNRNIPDTFQDQMIKG